MPTCYCFLSHVLDEKTPGFGGNQGFRREPVRRISRGDSSNSDSWMLSNHHGTHVDAPRHFADAGATLDSFSAASWCFKKPHLLDVSLRENQLLSVQELDGHVPEDCDLLLLRTGFEGLRPKEVYWKNNPGFAPEVGTFLRERLPNLRAIGFDFLSLTAFQHREIGRAAHRAFLDPDQPGRPVLIIEDMKLSELRRSPTEVIVLPLRVTDADGAPVTVLARI